MQISCILESRKSYPLINLFAVILHLVKKIIQKFIDKISITKFQTLKFYYKPEE